jgi:hypothetical protein
MLDSVSFQFASSYGRFCILVASNVLQGTGSGISGPSDAQWYARTIMLLFFEYM